MPPWTSRIGGGSSHKPSNSSITDAPPRSPTRGQGSLRITESDILDGSFGIPTIHSTPGRQTFPDAGSSTSKLDRNPSNHGRSMSHPFPSLFSHRKKKPVENGNTGTTFDPIGSDPNIPVLPGASSANKPSRAPEADLMTGKCMTCDSMVRWPKGLKVFRCTVCLTINDLVPLKAGAPKQEDSSRSNHASRSGTPSGNRGLPPAPLLSLQRTHQIIDRCTVEFLRCHMRRQHAVLSSSPPTVAMAVPGTASILPKDTSATVDPIDLSACAEISGSATVSELGRPDPKHSIESKVYSTSLPGTVDPSRAGQEDLSLDSIKPPGRGPAPQSRARVSEEDARTSQHRQEQSFSNPLRAFKPLEEYIIEVLSSHDIINGAFTTLRPSASRATSEGLKRNGPLSKEMHLRPEESISDMDAKTLLIGDIAENGLWWTGSRSESKQPDRPRSSRNGSVIDGPMETMNIVNIKSPHIDWPTLENWYRSLLYAGRGWLRHWKDLVVSDPQHFSSEHPSIQVIQRIEDDIVEVQTRIQRVLLKASETLLKRPGRPLGEPRDIRFLLIILSNPLLYPNNNRPGSSYRDRSRSRSRDRRGPPGSGQHETLRPRNQPSGANLRGSSIPGQHSGIIKRVLGLLSNLSNECHHHLVTWFARLSEGQFQRTVELIGSFVTYRLSRQHGKKRVVEADPTAGLIPSLNGPGSGHTTAQLHAALTGNTQAPKKVDNKPKPVVYNDDWQIKAASRVMALLFSANNSGIMRKSDSRALTRSEASRSVGLGARERAHTHGQILATSDFYNTLLDYSDLIADFEAWESKRSKFAFCQYPFFLSIWAKIQIMEHDAKRQMEVKAREAFFNSIMSRKTVNQYLSLRIRRDCLVEDSLKSVSEVIGTGGEEIKKGLRIEFTGEEGIDAGGLRKEWFLLLVRDVFNPDHALFTYDDDSHFCYFNPNSFETSDQYFLVGVVLGLAIYNSTIIDVALPPFAFRKLLAAAPAAAPGTITHAKPIMNHTLEDLAELRPALAHGLRQLLEFDGDVEATFCRDFVADVDRYGHSVSIPLCPGGENKPVTNANRREFVDLYVRYILDTAVARQFEPFKRGFFAVCGGNALSLFRPEEIELLIRGSDEPLDISSLRAVAICENWNVPKPAETEPVIQWFWQSFEKAHPKDQRKLLSFVTGSDRIPAMGATNLVIKLSCLGDDSPRYPVARTCFNMLSLWRYSSKEKLETMLWRAVNESEGFGLK